MKVRRRLAWAVWAATVAAFLGEVILLFATAGLPTTDPVDQAGPLFQSFEDLAFVAVGTLGLRLVLSQPANAVGWWIMVAGISFPLESVLAEFVQWGALRWGGVPVVLAAAWVSSWVWILGSFNLPFLLLLYPDGRLPSRRWRPALWLAAASMATSFVTLAFYAGPDGQVSDFPNPLGIPALTGLFDVLLDTVVFPSQSVMIVVAALSLVARFRGGASVERQQIKVLMWVAPVAIVFFATSPLRGEDPVWLEPLLNFGFTVSIVGALTLAVLRYRLYEIDRLISRTVSYATVAAIVAFVYGFGAVWLPSRLVGEQTPVFVAASTLAVAALVNPLRRRVMAAVDRRFNRSRYDAARVVERYSASLRDRVDTAGLEAELAALVEQTFHPSHLALWLRDPSDAHRPKFRADRVTP